MERILKDTYVRGHTLSSVCVRGDQNTLKAEKKKTKNILKTPKRFRLMLVLSLISTFRKSRAPEVPASESLESLGTERDLLYGIILVMC